MKTFLIAAGAALVTTAALAEMALTPVSHTTESTLIFTNLDGRMVEALPAFQKDPIAAIEYARLSLERASAEPVPAGLVPAKLSQCPHGAAVTSGNCKVIWSAQ